MRAAVVRSLAGPDGVAIDDFPDPQPGSGEVRLRVEAAGLNNSDLQATRSGGYGRREPPFRWGQEAAGVVEALGEGVGALAVGDRVAGRVADALAEVAVARADELLRIPDSLSFVDAAALPVGYLTAAIALVFQADVQPDEWVLVQAAAGAVGTAAVQLAKLAGANVIATSSSAEKRRRLLELGADHALDYAEVAAAVPELTGGAGIDVGLDGAGAATFAPLLDVLAESGRICMYGTFTGLPSGGAERIFIRNGTLHGLSLWTNRHYVHAYQLLAGTVLPALEGGRIVSVAESVFPLAQLADALRLIERREQFGKVVVTM